jgi:hypothetical protein
MINKIPFHRILALLTLLSVTLTACTPAPASTPTATMPVETPTPSATATEAPTATTTATPDPNMPPDATEFRNGTYYKTGVNEFGETVTLEWDPAIIAGVGGRWFSQKGEVILIPKGLTNALPVDAVQLVFQMDKGFSAPIMTNTPDSKNSDLARMNLASLIWSQLMTRWAAEAPARSMGDLFGKVSSSSSEAILHFTDMNGNAQIYNIVTGKIILRGVDEKVALNDPRFVKFGNSDGPAFLMMTTGNGNGDVISYVAPIGRSIASLSPKEFRQMALLPVTGILTGDDQSMMQNHGVGGFRLKFANNWYHFCDAADNGTPAIDIPSPPAPAATP